MLGIDDDVNASSECCIATTSSTSISAGGAVTAFTLLTDDDSDDDSAVAVVALVVATDVGVVLAIAGVGGSMRLAIAAALRATSSVSLDGVVDTEHHICVTTSQYAHTHVQHHHQAIPHQPKSDAASTPMLTSNQIKQATYSIINAISSLATTQIVVGIAAFRRRNTRVD
jgi:hypothetical protein